MSTIIRIGDKPKAVKNLGWILRHWQEIDCLGFNYAPDAERMVDGEFVAKLKDGSVYITEFASLTVFWNFADRPVFRGLKLGVRQNYDGACRVFVVGNPEYKRIKKLEYREQLDAILNTGIIGE